MRLLSAHALRLAPALAALVTLGLALPAVSGTLTIEYDLDRVSASFGVNSPDGADCFGAICSGKLFVTYQAMGPNTIVGGLARASLYFDVHGVQSTYQFTYGGTGGGTLYAFKSVTLRLTGTGSGNATAGGVFTAVLNPVIGSLRSRCSGQCGYFGWTAGTHGGNFSGASPFPNVRFRLGGPSSASGTLLSSFGVLASGDPAAVHTLFVTGQEVQRVYDPVPEPSTAALVALGLGTLGLTRATTRRRRR